MWITAYWRRRPTAPAAGIQAAPTPATIITLASLTVLLTFIVPTTRSASWDYCDNIMWNGWGVPCCGENNLWQMGYCLSNGSFILNCTYPPPPRSCRLDERKEGSAQFLHLLHPDCFGPSIQLGVCSVLGQPSWLDRAYTDSLLKGMARVRAAERFEPAQVPANLSRLARGHACWLEGDGSGAHPSAYAVNRQRLIETYGLRYNFYEEDNNPCPVVTRVQELYVDESSPSGVIEQWLSDSDAADVLRSDYTAVGVGTYSTAANSARFVAIFVRVEDYTYVNPELCPEERHDDYEDL